MNIQEIIKALELLAIQSQEDRKKLELVIEQTNKDRKKLDQDLGMRWDQAEEAVYRSIASNLKTKGIEVYNVYKNLKTPNAEYDVVAVNGKQVIVVEVKNKLKHDHLDYFETNRLPLFKQEFPQYKDYQILWWVWALIVSDSVERDAEKRWFFVFRQNGDHVEIINSPNFIPKIF